MSNPISNATTRFTDRVDDYVRWRPSYPAEVVALIAEQTGIRPPACVADIGSGTGISADLFLEAGYDVWGVEPNAAMQSAADTRFSQQPHFHSLNGTAEHTRLPEASIDLVVAAQAFHWFDIPQARAEFQRILRPPGWVALIWNTRRLDRTPFLREYEQLLLEHAVDYTRVRHENVDAHALAVFYGGPHHELRLEQIQPLDREGLLGRLRSSSYVPGPDHPGHQSFMAAAQRLFDQYAEAGTVTLEYDVQIHIGRLLS